MTLSRLNGMIKIFKGRTWVGGRVPSKTFIFVPKCPKLNRNLGRVYVSGPKPYHAEDHMIEKCGLPYHFYLTSAPCPDCAMKLYKEYQNKKKPTIVIAGPYQGRGKEGSTGNKKVNLHCLAMLMKAGFRIIPWNWYDFKYHYITNGECKEAINEMTNDIKMYTKRYKRTEEHLRKANDMIKKDDNFNICNTAANFNNGKQFQTVAH